MKKFFQRLSATILLVLVTLVPTVPVYAQQFSLLPVPEKWLTDDPNGCKVHMDSFEATLDQAHFFKGVGRDNTLGCAIQTGRITFSMIPFFISYVINFLLGLTGIICVLFIVIGGYRYVIGGLTDEKEKGKQTIMHALMGMGVALLAWTIVTVLINAVTG